MTITANNASKTYGTTADLRRHRVHDTGLVSNGDTVASVTETSTGSPATATVGTYPIVPSAATGTGLRNYTITYVNGTLTVNPAPLTITANGQQDLRHAEGLRRHRVHDTGLVANGDTITSVTETSTGAPASATVGTYPIVPSAATGDGPEQLHDHLCQRHADGQPGAA